MTGDFQVGFYERWGVRFPPATHQAPSDPSRLPFPSAVT